MSNFVPQTHDVIFLSPNGQYSQFSVRKSWFFALRNTRPPLCGSPLRLALRATSPAFGEGGHESDQTEKAPPPSSMPSAFMAKAKSRASSFRRSKRPPPPLLARRARRPPRPLRRPSIPQGRLLMNRGRKPRERIKVRLYSNF